jgi:hypothetical protein
MGYPYLLRQVLPYIHEQTVPTQDITITHNKDKPCPQVVLIDSGGNEFEAEIRRPNSNQIQVLTNVPIIFTAYIY